MKEQINQWWLPVVVGVLLTFTSIFLITQPVGAFLGLTILFGWLIFTSGGFNFAFAIRNRKTYSFWVWDLMIGIFEMVIGAALLFQPELSAESLILFTGFWLTFSGVARISGSFMLKKLGVSNWWVNLLSGILTLIFSFLIIINPIFGMFSVVYLVAIPMFISGIIGIVFGIQLKKLNEL